MAVEETKATEVTEVTKESEVLEEIEVAKETGVVEEAEAIADKTETVEETMVAVQETEASQETEMPQVTVAAQEAMVNEETQVAQETAVVEENLAANEPEVVEETAVVEETKIAEQIVVAEVSESAEETKVVGNTEVVKDTDVSNETELAVESAEIKVAKEVESLETEHSGNTEICDELVDESQPIVETKVTLCPGVTEDTMFTEEVEASKEDIRKDEVTETSRKTEETEVTEESNEVEKSQMVIEVEAASVKATVCEQALADEAIEEKQSVDEPQHTEAVIETTKVASEEIAAFDEMKQVEAIKETVPEDEVTKTSVKAEDIEENLEQITAFNEPDVIDETEDVNETLVVDEVKINEDTATSESCVKAEAETVQDEEKLVIEDIKSFEKTKAAEDNSVHEEKVDEIEAIEKASVEVECTSTRAEQNGNTLEKLQESAEVTDSDKKNVDQETITETVKIGEAQVSEDVVSLGQCEKVEEEVLPAVKETEKFEEEQAKKDVTEASETAISDTEALTGEAQEIEKFVEVETHEEKSDPCKREGQKIDQYEHEILAESLEEEKTTSAIRDHPVEQQEESKSIETHDQPSDIKLISQENDKKTEEDEDPLEIIEHTSTTELTIGMQVDANIIDDSWQATLEETRDQCDTDITYEQPKEKAASDTADKDFDETELPVTSSVVDDGMNMPISTGRFDETEDGHPETDDCRDEVDQVETAVSVDHKVTTEAPMADRCDTAEKIDYPTEEMAQSMGQSNDEDLSSMESQPAEYEFQKKPAAVVDELHQLETSVHADSGPESMEFAVNLDTHNEAGPTSFESNEEVHEEFTAKVITKPTPVMDYDSCPSALAAGEIDAATPKDQSISTAQAKAVPDSADEDLEEVQEEVFQETKVVKELLESEVDRLVTETFVEEDISLTQLKSHDTAEHVTVSCGSSSTESPKTPLHEPAEQPAVPFIGSANQVDEEFDRHVQNQTELSLTVTDTVSGVSSTPVSPKAPLSPRNVCSEPLDEIQAQSENLCAMVSDDQKTEQDTEQSVEEVFPSPRQSCVAMTNDQVEDLSVDVDTVDAVRITDCQPLVIAVQDQSRRTEESMTSMPSSTDQAAESQSKDQVDSKATTPLAPLSPHPTESIATACEELKADLEHLAETIQEAAISTPELESEDDIKVEVTPNAPLSFPAAEIQLEAQAKPRLADEDVVSYEPEIKDTVPTPFVSKSPVPSHQAGCEVSTSPAPLSPAWTTAATEKREETSNEQNLETSSQKSSLSPRPLDVEATESADAVTEVEQRPSAPPLPCDEAVDVEATATSTTFFDGYMLQYEDAGQTSRLSTIASSADGDALSMNSNIPSRRDEEISAFSSGPSSWDVTEKETLEKTQPAAVLSAVDDDDCQSVTSSVMSHATDDYLMRGESEASEGLAARRDVKPVETLLAPAGGEMAHQSPSPVPSSPFSAGEAKDSMSSIQTDSSDYGHLSETKVDDSASSLQSGEFSDRTSMSDRAATTPFSDSSAASSYKEDQTVLENVMASKRGSALKNSAKAAFDSGLDISGPAECTTTVGVATMEPLTIKSDAGAKVQSASSKWATEVEGSAAEEQRYSETERDWERRQYYPNEDAAEKISGDGYTHVADPLLATHYDSEYYSQQYADYYEEHDQSQVQDQSADAGRNYEIYDQSSYEYTETTDYSRHEGDHQNGNAYHHYFDESGSSQTIETIAAAYSDPNRNDAGPLRRTSETNTSFVDTAASSRQVRILSIILSNFTHYYDAVLRETWLVHWMRRNELMFFELNSFIFILIHSSILLG